MQNFQKLDFKDIPIELVYSILLKTNPKDIANYCLTYVKAAQVCADDSFWRMKLWRDYGQQEQMKGLTWKETYYFKSRKLSIIGSPMSASSSHYGIIDNRGNLYMAGDNSRGQIGNGSRKYAQKPIKILFDSKIISVACGPWLTLAVSENGDLYVWGSVRNELMNKVDQSKFDKIKVLNTPLLTRPEMVKITHEKIIKVVADPSSYTYAILVAPGRIYINGIDPVDPPDPSDKFVDLIFVGTLNQNDVNNIYGLTESGKLIGIFLSTKTIYGEIKFPEKIYQISAGTNHVVVASVKGNVYTWGMSRRGQLGVKSDDMDWYKKNFITPNLYQVDLPSPIKTVSAGGDTNAAITLDGKLFMWGYTFLGNIIPKESAELLLESDVVRYSYDGYLIIPRPIEVTIGGKIRHIKVGETFTLAVTEDGIVNYWGSNAYAPPSE